MKERNPTIGLLGASFDTGNLGVNALTAGTLKAFFERFPEGELFLFDYGKRATTCEFRTNGRMVPVQLVNIRFSKRFYLRNNIALLLALAVFAKCVPFCGIGQKVVFGNPWLRRMAGADLVASMAGGDSFSDIYGLGRFLYVCLPQLLALVLGRKLVLLPQTIGPFKTVFAKTVARIILKRAAAIYSRDLAGVEETRKLIAAPRSDEQVRFCYDVGFVVDPVRPEGADAERLPAQRPGAPPLVGFNVSGLLYMGGYTQNNMFGLRVDYPRFVEDVIDHLIREKGARVLLVPHVFGAKENGESDAVVCERIYASLKKKYQDRLYLARGSYDQGEIKHIIGRCDCFIGSRMHACIAALSQHIPTISIAYSRKFAGVMQTIGVQHLVADPRKLGKDGIIGIIDEAFEQRASLRGHLEATMPRVKETVLKLFSEIGALLQGR